ncbi:MAG: stage III sporulation protein AB [Clostridiales bacterium]|nr:stage III sporulation protein AB [Clostridiales bacterium]
MSSNLSKRVNELENSILLLEKMQTYLRYSKIPTSELIRALAYNENFTALTFLKVCSQKIEQGEAFPEAWKSGIFLWKDTRMNEKDKEILSGVSDILGSSDYESQVNSLGLTAALLEQNLKEALAAKNTTGKLYRSLGVLIGIGMAIFIA